MTLKQQKHSRYVARKRTKARRRLSKYLKIKHAHPSRLAGRPKFKRMRGGRVVMQTRKGYSELLPKSKKYAEKRKDGSSAKRSESKS